MIAIISVPPDLGPAVGADLCRDKTAGISTKETDTRVYFMIELLGLKGRRHLLRPDIEIQWFMTRAEAMAWAERDALIWRVQ